MAAIRGRLLVSIEYVLTDDDLGQPSGRSLADLGPEQIDIMLHEQQSGIRGLLSEQLQGLEHTVEILDNDVSVVD